MPEGAPAPGTHPPLPQRSLLRRTVVSCMYAAGKPPRAPSVPRGTPLHGRGPSPPGEHRGPLFTLVATRLPGPYAPPRHCGTVC